MLWIRLYSFIMMLDVHSFETEWGCEHGTEFLQEAFLQSLQSVDACSENGLKGL